MIHSDKKRCLDRERFVRWTVMSGQFDTYVLKDAVEDIIMGTEHIVDLDGLKRYVEIIPGYLFDDVPDHDYVASTTVLLVFSGSMKEKN